MLTSMRPRIIIAIISISLALIAIFKFGFYDRANTPSEEVESTQIDMSKPQIVQTDPSPLAGAVLLATQPIMIMFNVELENGPETKLTFDPPLEHTASISGDRKTLILTPNKPYPAGQGYTLTIKSDAKLANGGKLGFDKSFNVRTISYTGI